MRRPTLPSPRQLVAIAPRIAFEAVFAAVTFYCARPAFASLHLPLQDVPQHMAAISVLRRYPFDAGLRRYFELSLSRTQYLSVYALGVLLSTVFSIEYSTRLLVALTVVALPYALRYAMRRTGADERFASLVWPFAWNPQMMLGFLNFLIGIPAALFALGLFADPRTRTQRWRQLVLALLALVTFYSHLVPYGILGLGTLLMLDLAGLLAQPAVLLRDPALPLGHRVLRAASALIRAVGARLWRWVRELAFLVPSLVAAAVWLARSPARDPSIRAGGIGRQHIEPIYPHVPSLPGQFRNTLLELQGEADERALIAWGLGLCAALALGRAFRDTAREPAVRDARTRIAWLSLACAVLYLKTPESYGWIWPIHTRFALCAVLLLPLGFTRTRHTIAAWAVMAMMAVATVPVIDELSNNFKRWDHDELGDLDEALSHARPGGRLVALVPPLRSQYVGGNVPLIHAAAYYQVRGGDVATFSFADFPQSPFRFRDDGPRPARLPPRWEWETSLQVADPSFDYYDYVLARAGANDEAARMPERYHRVYGGPSWTLYERTRAP